jgi:hypothetical protein
MPSSVTASSSHAKCAGHMMFFDPQMFVGDDEPLFED